MRIMIDPGHRNNVNDFGACGNGFKESALALAISKKIKKELEENGIETYLTRSSESETIGINQRPAKAKQMGCQWLISVHINSAGNSTATGVEVCYKSQKNMAVAISEAMSKATGLRNRGAQKRDNLGVLNGFGNAILIECGFINNPNESRKIASEDFQNKLSKAVVKEFLKELNVPVNNQMSALRKEVKEKYKFDENTMNHLESFPHKESLYQAFLEKREVSEETRKFILKYKFGQTILNRVYAN